VVGSRYDFSLGQHSTVIQKGGGTIFWTSTQHQTKAMLLCVIIKFT